MLELVFDTWRSVLVGFAALGATILIVWGGTLIEQHQGAGWILVLAAIALYGATAGWVVSILRRPKPRPKRPVAEE